jgi:hypothetical protein
VVLGENWLGAAMFVYLVYITPSAALQLGGWFLVGKVVTEMIIQHVSWARYW